ncbi:MAG: four-helix bundle copper-binding protein [Anaerolineae bacterium]|nr:four-helix bundle copper-binding protein [Anaerolineae bacterium]
MGKLANQDQTMGERMAACIDDCQECYGVCLQTVVYCLNTGGKHAEQSHITMLLDCAKICQTSADFMLRSSPMHTRTCATCAEICEMCAEDCERFENDGQMAACAEICRRCAQSCREMATMAH